MIRPDAARSWYERNGTVSTDDGALHQIDETQSRLALLLAASGSEASHLIPLLSWITSIGKKFYQNRLLTREALAVAPIYEEVRNAMRVQAGSHVSATERLALNLLERYQSSPTLRTNWEARCAIGNLVTVAVARSPTATSPLVTQVMQESVTQGNWDLAQMLFDALHHADSLSNSGREFLLTTAVAHEHNQVRWNVAAALKSIKIAESDLRSILTQLLDDSSPWVVKELIEVCLKNQRMLGELARPANAAHLREAFKQYPQVLEHTLLSLGSAKQGVLSRELPLLVPGWSRTHTPPRALAELSETRVALGYDIRMLEEDFRKVEVVKAQLSGRHGRVYRAAEEVVFNRVASITPELQQIAIATYLRSTHDALAWASVRALFSGQLDKCEERFLHEAVSEMLTHPSAWIRRECVEETLRLEDSRLKYIALRQIEFHRAQLVELEEIRPYLVQIGMISEG